MGRVDSNQKAVVSALRKIPGVAVKIVSEVPNLGFDLVVGYRGVSYLVELKDGCKKWHLEESEEKMSMDWPGQWALCESLKDILQLIGAIA